MRSNDIVILGGLGALIIGAGIFGFKLGKPGEEPKPKKLLKSYFLIKARIKGFPESEESFN